MTTFSQMKFDLDEIAKKTTRGRTIIQNARKALVSANSELSAIQADYSGLIADIDQAVLDNPADSVLEMVKGEKDKLVVDFIALKSYCNDLITAFDGVVE